VVAVQGILLLAPRLLGVLAVAVAVVAVAQVALAAFWFITRR
jgi:hypothetical protein